jgi:hypothetical protein
VTTGPAVVPRDSTVTLTVTGRRSSGRRGLPLTRRAFSLQRTGATDARGAYRTTYVARTDQRWYAARGPVAGPQGLTVVR